MLEKLFKALNPRHRRTANDPTELRINSDLLCCPVCMDLFADSPYVIPCGHTFCKNCLNQLTASSLGDNMTFHCPLCRKSFLKNFRYPKNYLVDSILNSVEEWTNNDLSNENSDKNYMRLAMSRLKQKCDVAVAENAQLKQELEKLKYPRMPRLAFVCFVVGLTAFLTWRVFFI